MVKRFPVLIQNFREAFRMESLNLRLEQMIQTEAKLFCFLLKDGMEGLNKIYTQERPPIKSSSGT